MLQDEKDKIEPYMTVEDVCKYFSSTKETVYRWIKKNGMPTHRIGKRWRSTVSFATGSTATSGPWISPTRRSP